MLSRSIPWRRCAGRPRPSVAGARPAPRRFYVVMAAGGYPGAGYLTVGAPRTWTFSGTFAY